MLISKNNNRLIFLGTGGGKHVVSTQERKTGGIYFEFDGLKFVLDPGPGSLVNARALRLETDKFDGVLLSHTHLDHSNDVNAYLDGMIRKFDVTPMNEQEETEKISASDKKPFLITEESCVKLTEKFYPCVSKYHQSLSKVITLKHGESTKIGTVKISVFKADHYAPNLGFVIDGSRKIGYTADGTYYSSQEKNYEGCDILIMNVLVPKGHASHKGWHMSVDEAIDFLNKLKQKPKLVVLSHLSFWMMRSNMFKQTKIITDMTKIKTISADDFLEINLDNLNERHVLKIK